MIDTLFIGALGLLWIGVAYVVVLAAGGFSFYQRWRRRMAIPDPARLDTWPSVTVLIPAHNEERVIDRSLDHFAALDYPDLRVLVIDDASSDATAAICDRRAELDGRIAVVHIPAQVGGRGKSSALNVGLEHVESEYVAVYDADHRPHPDAIRRLVYALVTRKSAKGRVYVAAVGRILKSNRRRSLLNRFCSLEWTSFQWIVQAGRARLFDVVTLPGTHFVVETDLLRHVGGWDARALTEDLDLSIRIYGIGERVQFVPEATSEEQDPEQLRAWFRQRTRWVVGNYYVLGKYRGSLRWLRDPRIVIDYLALAYAYIVLFLAVVVSDVLFFYGIFAGSPGDVGGHRFLVLWVLAALVFVGLLMLAQAMEGEDDWRTPILALLMYVTYAQLWLVVAARGLYQFGRGELAWTRTPRFQD